MLLQQLQPVLSLTKKIDLKVGKLLVVTQSQDIPPLLVLKILLLSLTASLHPAPTNPVVEFKKQEVFRGSDKSIYIPAIEYVMIQFIPPFVLFINVPASPMAYIKFELI
jgi:hypothetical protein